MIAIQTATLPLILTALAVFIVLSLAVMKKDKHYFYLEYKFILQSILIMKYNCRFENLRALVTSYTS